MSATSLALTLTKSKGANSKAVGLWLAIGVIMLMIQIMLGGITRLTGSGLSITEWKPLLGALPPLNERTWQQSFEKYQQIAQFKQLNSGFSLADYKAIFFWEWLHREWARLIGLVFLIPFIVFIIKKQINRNMIAPLIILFILGGLQGGIGWVMVQSGLNDTDVAVSPIRLAVHFICALILLCYLFWFALKVNLSNRQGLHSRGLQQTLLLLLMMLFFQLIYGALMAGSHAALSAPTWPDMNGQIIPDGVLSSGTLLHNLLYNPFVIQLMHRSLAYIITITIGVWYYRAGKLPQHAWLRSFRRVPLLLVICQITLGVMALINSPFSKAIYFSVAHQAVGILLLLSVVTALFITQTTKSSNERAML